MKALLSIKPEFAKAIFGGVKRFEYRRSIFKKYVDSIVVYVTLPVGKVIGEFEVEDILRESVESLWSKTHEHSGISKELFDEYFSGKEEGYAIKIGKVFQYPMPTSLHDSLGVSPPQSFLYLGDRTE
jgi:predicted transcriptional regulator